MTPNRRTLIKGFAALPLAGLVNGAAAAGGMRFVVDMRMPSAPALEARARSRGYELVDPRGEIVALFLGQGAGWLASGTPLIGLTGYSDMHLMRDIARSAGRSLRQVAARTAPSGPSGFFWRV